MRDQPRPGAGHREAAESGRDFQRAGLERQVGQQRQTHGLVSAGGVHEAGFACPGGVERHQLGQALNGFGRVGAQGSQRPTRRRTQRIDALAATKRGKPSIEQERGER